MPLWATLDERLLPMLRSYRQRLPTLHVTEKADSTLLSEADLAVRLARQRLPEVRLSSIRRGLEARRRLIDAEQ